MGRHITYDIIYISQNIDRIYIAMTISYNNIYSYKSKNKSLIQVAVYRITW